MWFWSFLSAALNCVLLVSTHPVEEAPTASQLEKRASSSWFLPNLDHTSGAVRGYVPDLTGPNAPDYTYPVYVAVNSGDSQGFINALYQDGPNGDRDNMWLAGQPRVVYLPPGTYTLSSTVYLDTDTVIIGDANNPPTIAAGSGFSGDYLLCGGQGGDNDSGNGGESHFSVSIKNVILDTTANSANSNFIALSWRVAQNSALVNVKIDMPQGVHTGLWMGQGSTISVADTTFSYGSIGLHFDGHQQAQIKNMKFNDCTTGIQIDGGFTVSILAPQCNTVGSCIVFNSGANWVSVVDGKSTNSGAFFTSNVQYPNFLLENISKDTTNSPMVVVGGTTKVGGVTSLGTYIYGNVYGDNPVYQTNPTAVPVSRPGALAPGGNYPISSAPQYQGKTMADVINLKDASQNGGFTLHGDGSSDDTVALQGAFNTAAAAGKIGYLPFGIYSVTSTVTIPAGSEIYGEAWATVSGTGSAFTNEQSPKPIVQIGQPNQRGTAHIQDMRFTVGEQLPGAIILQVNLAGNNPADVAVYNSLITVGGTRSTQLSCSSEANCRGALIGLHLAPGSSAYIDNFWSWVADHASDDSGVGIRIAAKGGVLAESTVATWLVGLGSEHWWYYNLNYAGAQNVFTSLFQSETNYYQGPNIDGGGSAAAAPPTPFTPTSSDPTFSYCSGGITLCAMTVAQYYTGNPSSIYHYAAGSWNFFGGTQQVTNVMNTNVGNAHLHGYTNTGTQDIFRLPDGKQFGNGGSDGFGGSWGTLVADIESQS